MKVEPELPRKMSDLLELALACLKKVEKKPKMYRINMSTWHHPAAHTRLCNVCLAGAIMAVVFKLSPGVTGNNLLIADAKRYEQFKSLNHVRQGRWGMIPLTPAALHALAHMDSPTPYAEDRDLFFQDMETIVAIMRKYNS